MNIVDMIRERLPQEIRMKLNCVCNGGHWYESAYFPFKILVETICDVIYEEKNDCCEYGECVDVVNEITGLSFEKDEDYYEEDDDELESLFYSIC